MSIEFIFQRGNHLPVVNIGYKYWCLNLGTKTRKIYLVASIPFFHGMHKSSLDGREGVKINSFTTVNEIKLSGKEGYIV